ncbi:putative c-24 sterol reductase [Phaeomoniella chlamydospora]|uniref:Putative c-24 sterol reductase n=1 Tax=Phaeomoniella chlamydospora TaxID=158046 RepID=A0A0G2EM19_PHACM|nr:putative c-24 sterol reductase [Phaeomoniella chlamydospora]
MELQITMNYIVETPGRRTRSRKSLAPDVRSDTDDATDSATDTPDTSNATEEGSRSVRRRKPTKFAETNGQSNGKPNGHANGAVKGEQRLIDGWAPGMDPKIDYNPHYEFGGSWGVSAMMIGFPLLMYYMWIGATYYDGKIPLPKAEQTFVDFLKDMSHIVYKGAFPTAKAWAMYWTFYVVEGAFYLLLPGVYRKGKPLPHEDGKQLTYYCSAMWSFYTSCAIITGLHFSGLFKLQTIIDEFGSLMSVSILTGYIMSFYFYFSALIRGKQHRMTGYPVYDFFMGAELNPRLFGLLDFKMFFEVRIPWYILFLVTLGAAARQYDTYGYVSAEVGLLIFAHWLYANACSKGEECIITSWDMYYEKLGFMLTFWNLSGVPLSYCHAAIYLALHDPKTYHWNRTFMAAWFVTYALVYWVWDTANSQKNRFRSRETGDDFTRKTFPQLPWQVVENPRIIKSPAGTILADGWFGKARKPHYTCDLFFAISWALYVI